MANWSTESTESTDDQLMIHDIHDLSRPEVELPVLQQRMMEHLDRFQDALEVLPIGERSPVGHCWSLEKQTITRFSERKFVLTHQPLQNLQTQMSTFW